MSKKKTYRPPSATRERVPLFREVSGNTMVLCPFCDPPHPIWPDKISDCGTMLKVMAVQQVFTSRTLKKADVVCIRCGKGGGAMVAYGRGFVHTENCNPERRLLTSVPVYSEWARRVYNMPKRLNAIIQKFTGPVIQVHEVDEFGKETGNVLGYYFGVPSATHSKREHPEAGTRQSVS